MDSNKEIAIIGAGPSGLSMAIFLHDLGCKPTVFDKKEKISKHSKALGVNPRSLEIFKSFGITKKFLSNGRKMTAVNLWKADKHIYKNDFTKIKSEYGFMLIQPQKESEEILLEEVLTRNIKVKLNSEFINYAKSESKYILDINSNIPNNTYDCIVGADGGRSKVRALAGIEYKGYRYDEKWELFDVELKMDIEPDEGHIRLFPQGGMIMIRLKENIWRIAGNINSILNYLPKLTVVGKIHWESTFRINHQVAKALTHNSIVLIGDAAHLHSPIGARGMNLGIEDAFISSRLIAEDRLSEYSRMRLPYLNKTVGRINNVTMGMAGNSTLSKLLRSQIANFRFLFPMIMPRVRDFIIGKN